MEPARERLYHPMQRDYVTFLQTADETHGAYSLIEVELLPGGGNTLHYHSDFSEAFEVLEGELGVQVGSQHKALKSGEQVLVPPPVHHRFYNTSHAPVRFRVEIRPGHVGFEQSLRIGYGLAADGKYFHIQYGIPKNPLALGLITHLGGTEPAGIYALFQPLLTLFAMLGKRTGLDKKLAETYL